MKLAYFGLISILVFLSSAVFAENKKPWIWTNSNGVAILVSGNHVTLNHAATFSEKASSCLIRPDIMDRGHDKMPHMNEACTHYHYTAEKPSITIACLLHSILSTDEANEASKSYDRYDREGIESGKTVTSLHCTFPWSSIAYTTMMIGCTMLPLMFMFTSEIALWQRLSLPFTISALVGPPLGFVIQLPWSRNDNELEVPIQ